MDRDNEVVDGACGDLPGGKVPFARAAATGAQEDRDQRVNGTDEGSLTAAVPLAPCPQAQSSAPWTSSAPSKEARWLPA